MRCAKGQIDLELLLNFATTLALIALLSSHIFSLAYNTRDYRDSIYSIAREEEFVRMADAITSSGTLKKIGVEEFSRGSRIRNGTAFSDYGEKLLVGQSIYSLGGFDGEPV